MAKKTKVDSSSDSSGGSIAVNDAWTGMLVISLLALIAGSAFLAWDYFQYGEPPPTPKLTGSPPKQQEKKTEPEKKTEDEKEKKDEEKKGAALPHLFHGAVISRITTACQSRLISARFPEHEFS